MFLRSLHLGGNDLTGCVVVSIARIEDNDLDSLGLPICDGSDPPFAEMDSCSNGIAVPDPVANPGLVSDCEVLLEIRDTLAGVGTLDWLQERAVGHWRGIIVGGSPQRVTELTLRDDRVSGHIPDELGEFRGLRVLELSSQHLQGDIPDELGDLENLERLHLSSPQFTGWIPEEFGDLSELRTLVIKAGEHMVGKIPHELGNLSKLERLEIEAPHLSGRVSEELGRLRTLKSLSCMERSLVRYRLSWAILTNWNI